MSMLKLMPGHVRVLVERPSNDYLVRAARAVLAGANPADHMMRYGSEHRVAGLTIDPEFGAIPIGGGSEGRAEENVKFILQPGESKKFLVAGTMDATDGGIREFIGKDPVYSDPLIAGMLQPCQPTCGSSQAVGDAQTIRYKPSIKPLLDNGYNGSGVGIAIVDSGIFLPRMERLLGEALKPKSNPVQRDPANSWRAPDLVTKPFGHRVGHGTMCAFDALVAAPNAMLLDIPMLIARPVADHHSSSMVRTAILAYVHLLQVWLNGAKSFDALVVSNSWGMFHPSLEDFPPGHANRFIDNPGHIFPPVHAGAFPIRSGCHFLWQQLRPRQQLRRQLRVRDLSQQDRQDDHGRQRLQGGADGRRLRYERRTGWLLVPRPVDRWHVHKSSGPAKAGPSCIHALSGVEVSMVPPAGYRRFGGLPGGGRMRRGATKP